MSTWLAVAIGGSVGAVSRYGLSTWVQSLGAGFPWGTLSVNVTGSFAMGLLAGLLQRGMLPPDVQALLAVGVLGSFTTFSTFSLETLTLAQDGLWGRAGMYVVASVAVALVAAYVGLRITGSATPAP